MLRSLTKLLSPILSFINKPQFSHRTIYEGWLPTEMNWYPSIYPVNFSNTKLFQKGREWESLRFQDGIFVNNEGIERQPYVHCEAFWWKDDLYDLYPVGTPYSILLNGGDDHFQTKDYSSKKEMMKDLDLLMSAPIKYELLEELGFGMDI